MYTSHNQATQAQDAYAVHAATDSVHVHHGANLLKGSDGLIFDPHARVNVDSEL